MSWEVGLVFDDLDRLLQLTRMLASGSQRAGSASAKQKQNERKKKNGATIAINETKAARDNSRSTRLPGARTVIWITIARDSALFRCATALDTARDGAGICCCVWRRWENNRY